jgi:hypothetical protein
MRMGRVETARKLQEGWLKLAASAVARAQARVDRDSEAQCNANTLRAVQARERRAGEILLQARRRHALKEEENPREQPASRELILRSSRKGRSPG